MLGDADVGVLSRLLQNARGRLPHDFENAHGVAESFDRAGRPFQALAGQFGIVAFEGVVRGLANDNAAVSRNAFQAAGQIDLAPESGVQRTILSLLSNTAAPTELWGSPKRNLVPAEASAPHRKLPVMYAVVRRLRASGRNA